MVIRFPIIAATFMATSLSLGMLGSKADPAYAQNVITCESQSNQRNTCPIDRGSRVRFIRQLSDRSCRGNWGYGRNRIWVRNGCRGEFSVRDRGYNRYYR
ncbi:MAG: DUF3011 domain-containing protein [Stigonema ocellatum SAG 48.90 = DSM 106950]|nr:DUF3011 domain-containing protein [Stigonema ocellatum SAG 48.90 = DSM 106950]